MGTANPRPQQVLIIKHGAMGDLIQAMGILQDIRAHFSGAYLTLLTVPAYASLLQTCPYIDAIWLDNRHQHQPQLGRQLQQAAFDLVIDLQNSDRSRWYRWRWLRQSRWIARRWWVPAPASGLSGLLQLMAANQIPLPHGRQPDFSWLACAGAGDLRQLGLCTPYVVLIPGASRQHPQKRWPYYAALAAQIQQAGHLPVAILGPDEQTLTDSLPCMCLKGLSWPVLTTVLTQAGAVVANDTGPAHLAAHLGARGFALFGPTSAQRAEMATMQFTTWQVDSLPALDVDMVWQRLSRVLHRY